MVVTVKWIKGLWAAVTLSVVALLLPHQANAQSDAAFTQYFQVPTYYNPAAVGATDYLRIRGGSRLQWIGIENAPRTFLATADMPFRLFGKRFGTGIVLQQESLGLYNSVMLDAQIGYKLKMLKGELTIAAQVGMVSETFRGSEVFIPDNDDYHDSGDEAIPSSDINGTSIDLGVGAWFEHRWFWAGLSCTHVNSPTVKMSMEGDASGEDRSYEFSFGRVAYFMAGSNIPVKNTLFEVMPSVLVKSDFTFTQAEFTARVRYNKFLTAGLGYRTSDAVSLILGAEIKGFFIGYSYDYPVSDIVKASSGSHEVFAGYSLKLDLSEKNRHRHKSIRIM